MTDQETAKDLRSTKILIQAIFGFAIVALLIVVGFYFYQFHNELSLDNADWGTFGDFIGGILNPILSFLGLMALLFTIGLQSKELALNRKELELTRKELNKSAEAQKGTEKLLAEQTKTQLKQQFEGSFFSLLGELNRILDKLETRKITGYEIGLHGHAIPNETSEIEKIDIF